MKILAVADGESKYLWSHACRGPSLYLVWPGYSTSQMLGPRPSSFQAPSTCAAADAAPHKKSFGNSILSPLWLRYFINLFCVS